MHNGGTPNEWNFSKLNIIMFHSIFSVMKYLYVIVLIENTQKTLDVVNAMHTCSFL